LSTGGGGNSSEAGFASPGSRSAGGATFVTPGGNPAQAEKFASCVRSHGVTDFPDPSSSGQIEFSGAGAGTPQFQQAVQKCRSLLPNGGAPSPQQQQAAIASALKFSQCMRSHGITDFPDPTVSGGGTRISIKISVRSGQSSDLVPTSPAFQAAQKACRAFMPGGAFGGGPAKTSGSATGSS
jgi:hypothetical protein